MNVIIIELLTCREEQVALEVAFQVGPHALSAILSDLEVISKTSSVNY